jgi:transposase InsO family protein
LPFTLKEALIVLVELGLVEQRYKAVLEVLNDGASVTDVARRYGVGRQTVHTWLRRYAAEGLGGLVDHSARPDTCPHQMPPHVEARVLEMRRLHPGWGPRTILSRLIREGIEPVPGRTSIYRALVRHQLIFPTPRKRKPSDYKRWERSRPMELWQMDVTAGVYLANGTRPLVVTGIDDHSRFCVCASVVARATAKPVCDALVSAMESHGVPESILTDNGKVFTGRFGKGSGLVLFDRICAENGIRHLLTAPRSPTTTGKVERFHKTMKREFLAARSSTRSRRHNGNSTAGSMSTTQSVSTRAWATGRRLNDSLWPGASHPSPSWRAQSNQTPRSRRASSAGCAPMAPSA